MSDTEQQVTEQQVVLKTSTGDHVLFQIREGELRPAVVLKVHPAAKEGAEPDVSLLVFTEGLKDGTVGHMHFVPFATEGDKVGQYR